MPEATCNLTTTHVCSMNDTIYRITLYNKAIYRYISYTSYLVAGCTPLAGRHLERMPVILSAVSRSPERQRRGRISCGLIRESPGRVRVRFLRGHDDRKRRPYSLPGRAKRCPARRIVVIGLAPIMFTPPTRPLQKSCAHPTREKDLPKRKADGTLDPQLT
jgi:hypothetical protein